MLGIMLPLPAWILLAVPTPPPDVLQVPGDFPTIQGALDAAQPGDEVVVAPGYYLERLTFGGKDVVLRSLSGPAVTTIDGDGQGTVVHFTGGETGAAVLRGFTVTGGQGSEPPLSNSTTGGAITCSPGSAPTIVDNVLRRNHASWGGGVFAIRSSPVVRGNVIEKNAVVHFGGGAMLQDGDGVIEGNLFRDNRSGYPTGSGGAGGLYVAGLSEPRIEGNVFRRNAASTGGGALSLNNSGFNDDRHHAIVRGNLFEDNTAGFTAGALWATRAEPHLEGNVFRGNRSLEGGAIVVLDAEVTLRNDVLVDNVAEQSGGGLFVRGTFGPGANVHVERASFVGNSAGQTGSALWVSRSSADVASSLLWDNPNGTGTAVQLDGGSLALQRSLLPDGAAAVSTTLSGALTLGDGMLDEDPHLVPGAPLPFLASDSPCIDAGDPADVHMGRDASRAPTLQDGDLDGSVRADIGALEYTHVRLQARLDGPELTVKVTGTAGFPALLLVGTPAEPMSLGPWGLLLVGAPIANVALGATPVTRRVPVPPGFLETHPEVGLQVLSPLDADHGNTSNEVVLRSSAAGRALEGPGLAGTVAPEDAAPVVTDTTPVVEPPAAAIERVAPPGPHDELAGTWQVRGHDGVPWTATLVLDADSGTGTFDWRSDESGASGRERVRWSVDASGTLRALGVALENPVGNIGTGTYEARLTDGDTLEGTWGAPAMPGTWTAAR